MAHRVSIDLYAPTTIHWLEDNELRAGAVAAAAAITQDVQAKKINPANLVIMVGEEHDQLPIDLFEYYFMRELKTVFNDLQLRDESQQNYERLMYAPLNLTFDSLPDKLDEMYHNQRNPFCFINAYGAALYKIDYRPIDMQAYHHKEQDEFYLDQPFHIDVPKEFGNNSVMLQAYKTIEKDIPKTSTNEINVTCTEGLTFRDLYMASQILSLPQAAPVLTTNGSAHLSDTGNPGRRTLQEMLLANGKDVYTLQLSQYSRFIRQYMCERQNMCTRLLDQGIKQPQAAIYIQTHGYLGSFSSSLMRDLMALNEPKWWQKIKLFQL